MLRRDQRSLTARGFVGVALVIALASSGCEDDPVTDFTGPTGSTTVTLPVPFFAQQTQVWCWAATTSMVLAY